MIDHMVNHSETPSTVLCTWDPQSNCTDCMNHNHLHCKWSQTLLNGFLILAGSYMIVGFFGMIVTGLLTGVWWPLLGMIAFFPIFFIFLEIRVLCSHCPYYAEDSRILHCLANHGIPKLWRYRPDPLNTLEKITFLAGALFFGVFPFFTQVYGTWYLYNFHEGYDLITLLGLIGLAVATLLTAITFFAILRIHYCTRCVNFSCPLNQVPKARVDEYLERNPIMKQAWEQSGYTLGMKE